MSYETTINDLPDEMLEKILLLLRMDDRKSALRVCKRWSALKAFDLSSVQLVLDSDRFYEPDYQDYHRALLASNRRYKRVAVSIGMDFEHYDQLLEILSSFAWGVESLRISFEPVYKGIIYLSNCTTVRLSFFAKIAEMSSKLKHLYIDEGIFESDRDGLEFSSMNGLEELLLTNNLLDLIPNMQDITPNITRLHLVINSEESLNFLRHVSSQLVELDLWFKLDDDPVAVTRCAAVCSTPFPLLEKVSFSCNDDDEFDVLNLEAAIYGFFQQSRWLKGITLRNLDFNRVEHLCQLQSCENIRLLWLAMGVDLPLGANDLRAICKLQHLKQLRIENATVSAPNEFDFPPLKSLKMLSLEGVRMTDLHEFCRFRQYAFPSVDVFEMLELYDWAVSDEFDLYSKICTGMPILKRLALSQSETNLEIGSFLEFCATRRCRELRIRCRRVLDEDPLKDEFRSIPVETLIMDVSTVSRMTLQKLIQSMGALKRLELALCPFKGAMRSEEIRSLQVDFPECEVIVRQRVQIAEPL